MTESVNLAPMVPVRAFVQGFNAGDVRLCEASCASDLLILDDFPPHQWSGSDAVTQWCQDMERMSEEFGMSEPSVALQDPRHLDESEGSAYLVVPIDVRWLDNGAPAARTGAMTMALREGDDGWRISSLAWTWD